MIIGIRKEDKSKWEARTPLIPDHVRLLKEKYDVETVVQPSSHRAVKEEEYEKAGATIKEDLSDCDIIFGVKEVPSRKLQKKQSYVYFSHAPG